MKRSIVSDLRRDDSSKRAGEKSQPLWKRHDRLTRGNPISDFDCNHLLYKSLKISK